MSKNKENYSLMVGWLLKHHLHYHTSISKIGKIILRIGKLIPHRSFLYKGKNLNQISTRSNMRIGLLYYFLSAKEEVRMEALCKFNRVTNLS